MSSNGLAVGVLRGPYPQREEEQVSWLDGVGEKISGVVSRAVTLRPPRWDRIVRLTEENASTFENTFDDEVAQKASDLQLRLRERGFEDATVGACFALIREVAERTLGQRHFDVQLIGGFALLHGTVVEMQTGEGKTLTATLPACTSALAGLPVHIITVNDYLAKRDAETMGPIYRALGLSVGVVVSGMEPAARRAAYSCDVTYCTNKEVAFDYLKDRITLGGRPTRLQLQVRRLGGGAAAQRADQLIHRGLHFAIVDEADSILIDEARTPLIIADRKNDATEEELYGIAVELAGQLERDRDFSVDERESQIRLLDAGRARLEEIGEPRGGMFAARRRREELVRQALCALHLYKLDQHYLVQDEKVQIIDEYTGRVMADRSWEYGLHQMIEVKEGVPLSGRQDTRARISYQRFFRRYVRLAGMTGTAREVEGELSSVYRLRVVTIPTHRPLKRRDLGERMMDTQDQKWDAVVKRVEGLRELGRPVLVGTRSVAASETLSARLDEAGIPHTVLNARQDKEEAEVVARAGEPGRITVATNMAGRGTDIVLTDAVRECGGLHVLATERHDARRIDRQLQGRCGRQGDPGSFEAIVSLEDELLRQHGDALSRRIVETLAKTGAPQRAFLSRLALRRAQWAAGRLHARMRRELAKHDTQLDTMLAFSGRPE